MTNYLFNTFLFFSIVAVLPLYSQNPETDRLLKEIDETISKGDFKKSDFEISVTEFWQGKLQDSKYASEPVVKAMINYQIARSFAPTNIDSAKAYVTKALLLIEDIEGYDNIKVLIYNGLGNVSQIKNEIYLSSFYYNKVISILEANPSHPNISDEKKIQFYLHGAQANHKIGLFENAFKLNKKAERLLSPDVKNDYLWFRVYSQLFNDGLSYGVSPDSLSEYIPKIEQYTTSDLQKIKLYEHKADLFELKEQHDVAKSYFIKKLEYQKNSYSKPLDKVSFGNIYRTYCQLVRNSAYRSKISEAESYIKELKQIQNQNDYPLSDIEKRSFYVAMNTYYYKKGDLENYKSNFKKLYFLEEEIHRKAELQAKEEMQKMYELQENKRSIKNLNKSVEIKETQLENTQLLLIIAFLTTIVVLSGMGIFYYRQKSRELQQSYQQVVLEQKLLRTQMEPHFIFNTLSTLQSLIRFQEPKIAIGYLNKFSRLLRSNLELSRKEMISLEDEIETIHNYLQLQQARFKDYFTYQIHVPNELETDALLIPPMLIQPFVENSILHGFEGEGAWHIEIKITELTTTQQLQIAISDNGIGIEKTEKGNRKSFSGAITKERLEILSKKYGIATDYQIVSKKGEGTNVLLTLPIIS